MADIATPATATTGRAKQVLTTLGFVALVASAVVGSNVSGLRDRLAGTVDPVAPVASRVASDPGPAATAASPAGDQKTLLRSQPWWQALTTVKGDASTTTTTITVADAALQWRAKWTCETGALVVRVPGRRKALVDGRCPTGEPGYATKTGPLRLEIVADGPWELVIDQQIDTPLVEPPLPEMTAPGSKRLATGSFYRVDQNGTGTVIVYRLADGGHAVRLEDFFVTPNSDLTVHFSVLSAPKSTEEYTAAEQAEVSTLDVTTGSLNFRVPEGVDPSRFKSVVIWCERLHTAYSAATLVPAA